MSMTSTPLARYEQYSTKAGRTGHAMTTGRQRDHTVRSTQRRTRQWRTLFITACSRRLTHSTSAFHSTEALTAMASRVLKEEREMRLYIARRNRISASDFAFNFNGLTDADALLYFRFRKEDIARMIDAIAWPAQKRCTKKNRFGVTPLLATCIILRRLASPARWKDFETLFGKHASQLSEIFWEALEHMLDARLHLIAEPISASFMAQNAGRYATAVHRKTNSLPNCVGFIDGTVIRIARPKGYEVQRVAYNGHKRKHALKFQAVNSADGLIIHVYGPIEGRRHDWTMYTRSGLDTQLPAILEVGDQKYCSFGDSGCNSRWFMEIPYLGSNLNAAQIAFNKAMSSARITVEWIFKEIQLYFTTVDYKRKMKVFESPVVSLYLAAMLLSNMRNCIYPNQVWDYFACAPLP